MYSDFESYQQYRNARDRCAVTSVVEVTETPSNLVVIIAVNIQLMDTVVNVMAQSHIFGSGSAAFVMIRGNIRSEATYGAEAFASNDRFR